MDTRNGSEATAYQALFFHAWKKDFQDKSLLLKYVGKRTGELDVAHFRKSLAYYIQHIHKECNYIFYFSHSSVYKKKIPVATDPLQWVDLSRADTQDYKRYIEENFIDVFNLETGPLYKFLLLKLQEREYIFAWAFSHIIFDGAFSYQRFCEILEILYNGSATQWSAYNFMQRPILTPYTKDDIDFWQQKIQQLSFYQKLNFAKSNVSVSLPNEFFQKKHLFSTQETGAIKQVLDSGDFTLFHLIAATLSTLISKYNGEDGADIMLGYTLSMDYTKKNIGCFTNLNPLSVPFSTNNTPQDILNHVKRWRVETKPYQHVPIVAIANCLLDRRLNSSAFNIVVNHSPALVAMPAPILYNIAFEFLETPCTDGSYDISVLYNLINNQLHIQLNCKQSLFSEEQVNELFQNYKIIIAYFYTHANSNLSHCKLISHNHKLTGPQIDLDLHDGLSNEFQLVFNKYPYKIALIFKDQRWLYHQLENEIKKAIFLLENKLYSSFTNQTAPIVVGIYLKRSHLLVISLLSAICRNLCFVPLDPDYPIERLAYIINVVKIKYVITDTHTLYGGSLIEADALSLEFICIDNDVAYNKYQHIRLSIPSIKHYRHAPQYILFTSGTTGQPKGAIISQENLYNFFVGMVDRALCNENDYLLALSALHFDISILELLLPLYVGATVDIAPTEMIADSKKLLDYINAKPVTIIQATPATFRMMQAIEGKILNRLTLLIGGENIDPSLVKFLLGQRHTIYNMYGPTETTIWSTVTQLTDHAAISLGRPIANTNIYIWDHCKLAVPMGMAGALYIGGKGVGLGYVNAANDDFITLSNGEKVYKTGDIVIYYGCNDLRFLGRIDSQVKMRGFRIELNEITHAIKTIIDTYEVATVLRSLPDPHLIAFIQPASWHHMDIASIQKTLATRLPGYMLPQRMIMVHSLPLTPNLKIDYKRLQNDGLDQLIARYGYEPHQHIAETNEMGNKEAKIDVQKKVLKDHILNIILEEFDINIRQDQHDEPLGFFGFNSLGFNRLSILMKKKWGINIHPHHFYMHNTINKLHSYCAAHDQKVIMPYYANGADKAHVNVIGNPAVSIIGMAGQLPQATTLHRFWENLICKKNAITPSNRPTLLSTFQAGFMHHIDQFDPAFFNTSPLEAMAMDPEQRLLLSTSWHALEDAGYNPLGLAGSNVGVYVAVTQQDYYAIQNQKKQITLTAYTMPGISSSMLANRLSYFFNWNGPSQTIDTACSGSLIAVHKAYHDLLNGVIDLALVASSNIILDQHMNDALHMGNFLSPLHRCATFDASADGYVRGEGVGCILLKRQVDAEQDGDHSYGTIVSSAENHGGRAHSLTAPNPIAQKNLLLAAYKDIELAKQVSYIETHGTGTQLGDPIEVEALKMAWKEMGIWNHTPQIGLGALKSHIGHLEPAAGIAALLKVLLCLQHKMLPGNLHFHRINPYIDLKNSPFYTINDHQTWEGTSPKVAGISAFGFGGSNAHVVIMEPTKRKIAVVPQKPAYLICISAKNRWSLVQYIPQLRDYLAHIDTNDLIYHVANIAATLNQGRAHFAYRMAWIVHDLPDLKAKLEQYDPHETIPETPNRAIQYQPLPNWKDAPTQYLSHLQKWKEWYLQGYELDWNALHGKEPKMKISLPAYLFNTQPYWFEQAADKPLTTITNSKENSNDMSLDIEILDYNTAQIIISASHVWFTDHIVDDRKMLPGVAHLNIIGLVAKHFFPHQHVRSFINICWVNPIICDGSNCTFLVKITQESTQVSYSILDSDQKQLFSTGAWLIESSHALHSTCSPPLTEQVAYSKQYLYQCFEQNGISYGSFFQALQAVKIINAQTCYAKIEILKCVDLFKTNLLDSAFQSILGLSIISLDSILMPFSAGKIIFSAQYGVEAAGMFYAYTEKISAMRVNITICNDRQEVIAAIYDLGVRPLLDRTNCTAQSVDQKNDAISQSIRAFEHVTYVPRWQALPLIAGENHHADKSYILIGNSHSDHWIAACVAYLPQVAVVDFDQLDGIQQIQALLNNNDHLQKEIWLIDATANQILDTDAIYHKAYFFIQLCQTLSAHKSISLRVITKLGLILDEFSPSIQPQNSILLGLAQTAAKEFMHLQIVPFAIDAIHPQNIALINKENNDANPHISPILITNGKRYIRTLVATPLHCNPKSKFRHQGTYFIIGGLGGLGMVLCEYLLKTYHAHVILIGRRQPIDESIDALMQLGGKITYEQVDVLDLAQLEKVILKYPHINGMIHSALVLQDKTIQLMDQKTLYDVLDPKVKGTVHILQILSKHAISLDFILFFSSIQSFIANPGQANYTAACLFKDEIAALLRNVYMYETKVINWGYWGNVGIVATDSYRKRMAALGIGSIEPAEGLRIIENVLSSDLTQIAVIKATQEALRGLNIKCDAPLLDTGHCTYSFDLADQKKESLLDKIVSAYYPNSDEVMHHERAQNALENYSRYSIQRIALPGGILRKYEKLKIAIDNMVVARKVDQRQILIDFPWLKGHIDLLDRCLQHYPKILTGAVDYMNILFPDGKFDHVEPVYRDHPIADYYNQVVSQVVQNFLKWNTDLEQIKILEIGAGTGSTAKFVLPILDPHVEYHFTDISFAFLKKAQMDLAHFNNVVYRICNIEETPHAAFGHFFDIVIATNVLHATGDIVTTVKHVRRFLKSDGILILNEITAKQDYATLTFGLTPGWWLFKDFRIADCPLLSPQAWVDVLTQNGFSQVKAHGSRQQQVIVAVAGQTGDQGRSTTALITDSDHPSWPTPANLNATSVHQPAPLAELEGDPMMSMHANAMQQWLKDFIIEVIAQVMKIPHHEIKSDVIFSTYGIDSLIVLELFKTA